MGYREVWNSNKKEWEKINIKLSNAEISLIERAWNNWLWDGPTTIETECPWRQDDKLYTKDIKEDLYRGMIVDQIIDRLKKLPKSTILTKSVVLNFESYN